MTPGLDLETNLYQMNFKRNEEKIDLALAKTLIFKVNRVETRRENEENKFAQCIVVSNVYSPPHS